MGLVTCGVVQLRGKRMVMALGDVALEVFFLDLDRLDSGWFELPGIENDNSELKMTMVLNSRSVLV